MKNFKEKCFQPEHSENQVINYCPECQKFMCELCDQYHSKFLGQHKTIQLDYLNEELNNPKFKVFCEEVGHENNKLTYLCQTHNILCCGLCICKRNENNYGKHNNCNIIKIEEALEEKKITLNENIDNMDKSLKIMDKSITEIKKIIEASQKNKKTVTFQINNIFNNIKEALNKRETELNKQLNEFFDKSFNSKINVEEIDNLANKSRISLYIAKNLKDNYNNLELLQVCINLENNLKENKNVQDIIQEYGKGDYLFKFSPEEIRPSKIISEIENFGEIKKVCKFHFKDCPPDISPNKKYEISGEYKSIATKTSGDNIWQVIIADTIIPPDSIVSWKIKILSTNENNYIMIGVCPYNIDLNTVNPYSVSGWYFYLASSSLYSGPPHRYYNKATDFGNIKEYTNINSEIQVIMDTKEGQLSFVLGNENHIVAFDNIPKYIALVPCVILHNINDSVEILP